MFATVTVTEHPIDLAPLLAEVSAPARGAVILFIGTVRDEDKDQTVLGITYDAFVPLATRVLSDIVHECTTRWGTALTARVIHRIGWLTVGEASVAIAVAAPHRAEAYDASRYIIEQIKVRVPIWKQEHYADGKSVWLPGTPLHPRHPHD